MFPTSAQFRKWSYPEKFGVVSAIVSIVLGAAFWLFPDTGKAFIATMSGSIPLSVDVPGRNTIERQINLAKMQDPQARMPSTEFASAVVFARPSLPRSQVFIRDVGLFAASNASPLRSSNQDLVFTAGKCRFAGHVSVIDSNRLLAEAPISMISCLLDNGDSYGLGTAEGPPIGFLTRAETPTSTQLSLVQEGRLLTLQLDAKYVVRLYQPLKNMPFVGKSAVGW